MGFPSGCTASSTFSTANAPPVVAVTPSASSVSVTFVPAAAAEATEHGAANTVCACTRAAGYVPSARCAPTMM